MTRTDPADRGGGGGVRLDGRVVGVRRLSDIYERVVPIRNVFVAANCTRGGRGKNRKRCGGATARSVNEKR